VTVEEAKSGATRYISAFVAAQREHHVCLVCDEPISDYDQVGRCVYGHPCGHRQYHVGNTKSAIPRPITVKCGMNVTVTGVYATAHTSIGDIDTKPPSAVRIDCELITFEFPIREQSEEYRITSITLHFGVTSVTVPVVPATPVKTGSGCTVVQSVSMVQMLPGGPTPVWSHEI